jgi:hypothetical protein
MLNKSLLGLDTQREVQQQSAGIGSHSKKKKILYGFAAAVFVLFFAISIAGLLLAMKNNERINQASAFKSKYVIPGKYFAVEGVNYDPIAQEFLFGSIAHGTIYSLKPGYSDLPLSIQRVVSTKEKGPYNQDIPIGGGWNLFRQ